MTKTHRYSISQVRQGAFRFITLTMPSDVLAETSFVSSRDEDSLQGFQRLLDKKRAQQIADYIDQGLGTIPTSIVLSAQAEANLRIVGNGKTVEFDHHPRAFLILDGQHRVYGFSLATTSLRVPVVIYDGLTRRDETRLFIDINTKQRAVPNELLLDIRKLAEYQDDLETLIGEVFDLFETEPTSSLRGLLSGSKRQKGKISRVTFNAALKSILKSLEDADAEQIFQVLAPYIEAFQRGCQKKGVERALTNPVLFRATVMLFPEVAQKVNDRYGPNFNKANFAEVLEPLFLKITTNQLKRPGNSVKNSHKALSSALHSEFKIRNAV